MPKKDAKTDKPNPNSLDKLAQLASSASEKKRKPPIQEVRPVDQSQPAAPPEDRSAVGVGEPKAPPVQPTPPKAEPADKPEEELMQLNVRMPRRLIEALDMAIVMEKRKQERRVTQRELVEQAVSEWLAKRGYR